MICAHEKPATYICVLLKPSLHIFLLKDYLVSRVAYTRLSAAVTLILSYILNL